MLLEILTSNDCPMTTPKSIYANRKIKIITLYECKL